MLGERSERLDKYLSSVDKDKKMDSFIYHTMVVNWQGSGKDLLINAEIFEHYFFDVSLFHNQLYYMLFRPHYQKYIKNIYSNATLNKDVYGDDYYKIDSLSDIANASDGIMYLHDMEKFFNSRGQDMTKPSPELIDMINNTRKDGLLLDGSCHRYMSIDVKIRELFQLIIVPKLVIKPDCDGSLMRHYTVVCELLDCYGKSIGYFVLDDLYKYADLYNTKEKSVVLIKDL